MRILMISDVYFPRVNGVSTSIRTARRELLALGHRVTLVVPTYSHAGIDDDDDDDLIRVPSRGVPRDPEDRMMRRGYIHRLLPELLANRYDIVHIHTPFVAHYAGLTLARHLNVPVIESYHTFFEEYLYHYVPLLPRSALKLFARRFTVSQCNSVDRIISPSRAMQAALVNYGVRKPIDILPTGLEPSQFQIGNGARFRLEHGIPLDQPVLLYVGRVAFEKNIEFLLRVFKEVLACIPNALLLIVGEGPALGSLQKLAEELRVNNSVKFIGYLDRDTELLDCYRAGDLFVFASRTETQGLVLLESLAQGTPVVSIMHMGTRDVLEHARGACIANDNPQVFANTIATLLRDKVARNRLAMFAPLDASKWSSREMAERLTNCYSAAIQSKSICSVPSPRASA